MLEQNRGQIVGQTSARGRHNASRKNAAAFRLKQKHDTTLTTWP